MGVQVIENWSLIQGSVLGAKPHAALDGYVSANIHVLRVSSIAGYADLFSTAAGSDIDVNVPAEKWNQLRIGTGAVIEFRIRKAGPFSAFADPDSISQAD
jgi:hypothetical protein